MIKIDDPAFDYEKSGQDYSNHRQTDARIAAYVHKELRGARTVLNVGAGAGSYEPTDAYVVAVEPSLVMRQQRLRKGKVPAVNAKADNLPFDDTTFDAAMAMVTIHHWPDIEKGLQELRRVTKGAVVIMTFDPNELDSYWSADYFHETLAVEKARYPSIDLVKKWLGGQCREISIPVPLDCKDGFQEAFYGRPEAFLDKRVRQSQSAWGFISDDQQEIMIKRLKDDLDSGAWDRKYGHYRKQKLLHCALRLVVSSN